MKAHMPYDCGESENVKAWKKLPPCCQHFIRTVQASIQEEVEKNNPSLYRPTSGFRAESINRKYHGSVESLHRLGMARDFVDSCGSLVNPPVVNSERFRVIRSSKCWHVETII